MSHSIYNSKVKKILLPYTLSFAVILQTFLPTYASADDADAFIAQTHKIAESVASNQINMLMLGALQQAIMMRAPANTDDMVGVMKRQLARIQGLNSYLTRLYLGASDDETPHTSTLLRQIHSEFLESMTALANQRLKLDGLRRDASAFRANMFDLAKQFTANLKNRCTDGLRINPYRAIAPAIIPLMPAFNLQGGAKITEDGEFHVDSEKSAVMFGTSPEEQAQWVLILNANIILTNYLMTGHLVMTGLATSAGTITNAAYLGGLGITLALAVVVYYLQTQEARNQSKKIVEQQRRIFNQRADHEGVNRTFTQLCKSVSIPFENMENELLGLYKNDPLQLKEFEENKNRFQEKINLITKLLTDYAEARKKYLGDDFAQQTPEVQNKREAEFKNSPEALNFYKALAVLKPDEIASMIAFIFKDLYLKGSQYASEAEKIIIESRDSLLAQKIQAEQRAQLILKMATDASYAELEIASDGQLDSELKLNSELSHIYESLDRLVIDFANQLASGKILIQQELHSLDLRLLKILSNVDLASTRYPKSSLLSHIKENLKLIQANLDAGHRLETP